MTGTGERVTQRPTATPLGTGSVGEPPAVVAGGTPARFVGRVRPEPRVDYLVHEFDLGPGATALTVTLRYRKERLCQLFLTLFDPVGYRGTRMNPGGYGDLALELRLSEGAAGPGALPGPLRPGRWRILIDVDRTSEEADYAVEVAAAAASTGGPMPVTSPAESLGDALADDAAATPDPTGAAPPVAGWYRSELHAHSWHSDGKVPVGQVTEAARAYGLDFLALTDHFTTSGWAELAAASGERLAVLRGLEMTGHSGHANLHGLDRWINVYPDGPARDAAGRPIPLGPGGTAWDINAVARACRAAGGLFCVNHPFAGDTGWRYHEFDWGLADLLEVYHHLDGPHNALHLGLWDELLRAGRRIVGVAGTDSHHPREERHRLGQCFTYVHAPELSAAGIVAGLRSGRVYASLGPQLEFMAVGPGGAETPMGDTVVRDDLRLRVALDGVRYPAQLILLKNGWFHAAVAVEPGAPAQFEFADRPTAPGYYRLELYAVPPGETRPRRETTALLLLSNPIYVA